MTAHNREIRRRLLEHIRWCPLYQYRLATGIIRDMVRTGTAPAGDLDHLAQLEPSLADWRRW